MLHECPIVVCYKMGAQVAQARFPLQNGLYKTASSSSKQCYNCSGLDPSHFIVAMATKIVLYIYTEGVAMGGGVV